MATVVTPDTLMRWHGQLIALKWTFDRKARPSSVSRATGPAQALPSGRGVIMNACSTQMAVGFVFGQDGLVRDTCETRH
jgi:hypothetical protein